MAKTLTKKPSRSSSPSSNLRPTLGNIDDLTVLVGEPIEFTAVATDPDRPDNILTYRLAAGPPDGASIDSDSGRFTWTPTAAQSRQIHNLSVVVSDNGAPELTDVKSFTVTVANSSPVLAEIDDVTIDEMTELSISLSATDADLPNDELTYSLESGPAGTAVDRDTGLITWTPTEAQGPGSFTMTVSVTDLDGASSEETFTVTVEEVNLAPVIGGVDDQTVNEGETLSLQLSASDSDLPANDLRFEITEGPDTASIDAVSGLLTWTPAESDGPSVYSVCCIGF